MSKTSMLRAERALAVARFLTRQGDSEIAFTKVLNFFASDKGDPSPPWTRTELLTALEDLADEGVIYFDSDNPDCSLQIRFARQRKGAA